MFIWRENVWLRVIIIIIIITIIIIIIIANLDVTLLRI